VALEKVFYYFIFKDGGEEGFKEWSIVKTIVMNISKI
jgi:hypothetical protein